MASPHNESGTFDIGGDLTVHRLGFGALWLTGPDGIGRPDDEAVAGALDAVAERHDATRRQVALAWLLERSPVTLPIPGTADATHVEENVAATHIDLTEAETARLDDAAPAESE